MHLYSDSLKTLTYTVENSSWDSTLPGLSSDRIEDWLDQLVACCFIHSEPTLMVHYMYIMMCHFVEIQMKISYTMIVCESQSCT